MQELFVKVWNQREELKIHTDIKNYLFRATTNASLNYLKKDLKMVHEEAALEDKPDPGNSTDNMVRNNQLQSAIEAALKELPPRCRTIFILNRYEGMNYQEIADHLHISFHTVKNQMTIALSKLKGHLKEFIQK